MRKNDFLSFDAFYFFISRNFFKFGLQIFVGDGEFFAEFRGVQKNVSNLLLRKIDKIVFLVLSRNNFSARRRSA